MKLSKIKDFPQNVNLTPMALIVQRMDGKVVVKDVLDVTTNLRIVIPYGNGMLIKSGMKVKADEDEVIFTTTSAEYIEEGFSVTPQIIFSGQEAELKFYVMNLSDLQMDLEANGVFAHVMAIRPHGAVKEDTKDDKKK